MAAAEASDMARVAAGLKAQWAEAIRAGTAPATAGEPSIVSAKILTPTVNVRRAPALPKLQFVIDNGTVGAAEIAINMTSPSGRHAVYSLRPLPAYPAGKTRTLDVEVVPTNVDLENGAFGLYAEAGVWTVTGLELINNDGSYTQGSLSGLSAGVHVINTSPDIVPPTVGSGMILTPQVNVAGASPYFALKLSVGDGLSGVVNLFVAAFGPNGSEVFASSVVMSPVTQGDVVAYVKLPQTTPTGTYTVGYFTVTDAAGNSTELDTPAAVSGALGNARFSVVDVAG